MFEEDYMTALSRKESSIYIEMFYDLCFHNQDGLNPLYGFSGSTEREKVLLKYLEMVRETPIYRIKLHDDNSVEASSYDLLDEFKPKLKNSYETIDELPKWVQDRLAVLMLLDPNKVNSEVENVGRRINKNIFWVFDTEVDDGFDA